MGFAGFAGRAAREADDASGGEAAVPASFCGWPGSLQASFINASSVRKFMPECPAEPWSGRDGGMLILMKGTMEEACQALTRLDEAGGGWLCGGRALAGARGATFMLHIHCSSTHLHPGASQFLEVGTARWAVRLI